MYWICDVQIWMTLLIHWGSEMFLFAYLFLIPRILSNDIVTNKEGLFAIQEILKVSLCPGEKTNMLRTNFQQILFCPLVFSFFIWHFCNALSHLLMTSWRFLCHPNVLHVRLHWWTEIYRFSILSLKRSSSRRECEFD